MADAERKQMPVLMPERIGLADHKRHDFIVDLPLAVTLEQALEPSYWAHVAEQMQPLDHIEVRADDGSWVADLVVRFCERNYAKVVLKQLTKLEGDFDQPLATAKHKVEWKGPHMKWCVIRLADNQLLKQGETDKHTAYLWMQEHEKTMGR